MRKFLIIHKVQFNPFSYNYYRKNEYLQKMLAIVNVKIEKKL